MEVFKNLNQSFFASICSQFKVINKRFKLVLKCFTRGEFVCFNLALRLGVISLEWIPKFSSIP